MSVMESTTDFIAKGYSPDGSIAVDDLIKYLHINKTELAAAAGLPREAVSKRSRVSSLRTQRRLGEMVEIINRILPWVGTVQTAFAWYRSQPLRSFGDLTAEDLVKAGRGEVVRNYLSRVAAGGYT
ncbi:MAG: XRE family transcriptional regulator [Wenzhouxiangella sp.]|nr:XRE family transcriptional regulator [Wenzhouxiangella sp.]